MHAHILGGIEEPVGVAALVLWLSAIVQGQDSRNKLFALMHAGIPSVNSLQSAYMCVERPTVFGELKKIQKYHLPPLSLRWFFVPWVQSYTFPLSSVHTGAWAQRNSQSFHRRSTAAITKCSSLPNFLSLQR